MKNISPIILGAILISSIALNAYATTCPYDSDYKFVLQKALTDYYSNPQASKLQPSEISSLLNFYLSSETITNSNCDQGGIVQLLNKADMSVPDSTLLNINTISTSNCDACPDGAVCGEENDHGQTCTCKDVDNDGRSEYCYLKPIVPPKPNCLICPDGTLCGEQNYKDETCLCTDVNNDQEYEYCRLKPINEPTTTTTTTPVPKCLKWGQNKCDGQTRCCEGYQCMGDLNTSEQNTCCKPGECSRFGKCTTDCPQKCYPYGSHGCDGQIKCCQSWQCKGDLKVPEETTCCDQGECSIDGRCTTDCPQTCKPGETKTYTCPDKTQVSWCTCTSDYIWSCINSPETQCNCVEEGGSYTIGPNAAQKCCKGLTSIGCDRPDGNGNCPTPETCTGATFCTKCGNGQCGPGENKCNCPQDCEQCKQGTIKAYTCSDQTHVNWCTCTEKGTWACINSPETKCTPNKACKTDTECVDDGTACHVCVNQNWLRQNPDWTKTHACAGIGTSICKCVDNVCTSMTICGDGTCDTTYENATNCPKDCTKPCLEEGMGAGGSDPLQLPECCQGLAHTPIIVNMSTCTKAPDNGFVCTKCGNGVCGPGENKCSCPQDCNSSVTSTTTTSSTTRPSTTTTSTTRGTTTTTKPPGPGGKMLWFAPDQRAWPGSYAATLDYNKLFTDDSSWATARSYVNVFKFYGYSMTAGPNAFTDSQVKLMVSKLNSWDISIALELEPIRTNPYCTGAKNAPEALALMDRLAAYGGRTAYIDIDEAYYHGSKSVYGCSYSMSRSADETISFMNLIHAKYPDAVIGDIEPYPYFSAATLEQWITTFRQRAGYELPFFHLDVDRNDRHWNINDVKALETFCRGRGIRFGVIYNDNVQPFARSDQGFYQRTMDWASVVKAGRVTPEDRILQSWNDRPDYNLPDSSGYSFTELVRDFARKY